MDAPLRAALLSALTRNDMDAAGEVLRTGALAAARCLGSEDEVEDAFGEYFLGDLLNRQRYTDFREALAVLVEKCPTDAALAVFLKKAIGVTLRRMRYHAGPNKKELRRLLDQVKGIAHQTPAVFRCEARPTWPVGLAKWPDAERKGCLCAERHFRVDEEDIPDSDWPNDRPADLPPQPDTPPGSRVPPYPPELLAARMRWMLTHRDRYIEGALLSRWLWLMFCGADHTSVTSADRQEDDGDGEGRSEYLAADDDADTRVCDYEDAAELFVRQLPTERMRAVWFGFVLPEAFGYKVGLVAMGKRLGVSHATVDNDAKAVIARLRDFVFAQSYRPKDYRLLLRAAHALSAAAREE